MTKEEIMKRVVAAAQEAYQDEGRIEVDDNAKTSIADPPDDGLYVQAWVWVSLSDLEDEGVGPEELTQLAHVEREVVEEENRCPHGRRMGSCPDCDLEGDLAFDAMRENQRRHS